MRSYFFQKLCNPPLISSFFISVWLSNPYFSFVCPDGIVVEPDLSTVFSPDHKAAMVLFLDRVYGIENQSFILHLIEVGFLPDLQAAVSLDAVSRKNLTVGLFTCLRDQTFKE